MNIKLDSPCTHLEAMLLSRSLFHQYKRTLKYCLSELEESTNKWPCYECNKRFKTSALLQKHLAIHDNSRDYIDVMDDSDTDVTIDFGKGKAGKNGKVK